MAKHMPLDFIKPSDIVIKSSKTVFMGSEGKKFYQTELTRLYGLKKPFKENVKNMKVHKYK